MAITLNIPSQRTNVSAAVPSLFTGPSPSSGITLTGANPATVATVNPQPLSVTSPSYGGATRDQIVGLYRSIGLPDPAEQDIAYWQNFSRTNPDVLGAENPFTQLTNAFRAAATPALTPDSLPTTGESRIDPAIAPYLSEALGVARNLFLKGTGPELYPGQMYVSPSAATLDALKAAETLGRSTTTANLGADVLGAYSGALGTLSNLASPDYMKSQEYKDYVESVTRPVTEAVTEQILPAIASQYSAAGRYGSGAMTGATASATERGTRALGDITSQIAQRERENQFGAATALPTFLSGLSGVTAGALAPSGILAGVGAQREAIAGQPLQEAIRRFEYGQNLPYNQLSGYLSSIYGSPLGNLAQPQDMPGNTTLQNIGGFLSTAAAIPGAVKGVQSGINFLGGLKF
jgi:hypothetical protein